jgi:hypothetical protein
VDASVAGGPLLLLKRGTWNRLMSLSLDCQHLGLAPLAVRMERGPALNPSIALKLSVDDGSGCCALGLFLLCSGIVRLLRVTLEDLRTDHTFSDMLT